jgi:hypothetical protein
MVKKIRKIIAFPFWIVVFITFCLSDIFEWISRITEAITYAIEGTTCQPRSPYDNVEIDYDPNEDFKY